MLIVSNKLYRLNCSGDPSSSNDVNDVCVEISRESVELEMLCQLEVLVVEMSDTTVSCYEFQLYN
jgi:hypothetical protein